jgi:hypothetical protein
MSSLCEGAAKWCSVNAAIILGALKPGTAVQHHVVIGFGKP